jgi:iron complex outermembrane recepter protein
MINTAGCTSQSELPCRGSASSASKPCAVERARGCNFLHGLRTFVRSSWLALVALVVTSTAFSAAGKSSGTVTGYVSNSGTGNLLEGAKVELPKLGLVVSTDRTGRFVVNDVPTGSHEIQASYLGYNPIKTEITVAAGERVTHNFDLSASVHVLDAFTVSTEREGGAAAIMAQRNAENLKAVVSTDSFGNVPNMNPAEIAIRLPGVTGTISDEGNTVGFEVRGMAHALNTITVDGTLVSTQSAMGRSMRMHNLAGSMFEQIEVIKGHTPDKGADSLGGTINLKSRSPLSMKEKRRFTYNLSGRLAPSFTEQIPLREEHRFHPLLNAGYQEVFSVFGGERNLGVDVNVYYSELAVGSFRTTRDFQNTTSQPAFVWDYRMWDNYNNRKNASVNVKVDYRLSPTTKLTFNNIYSNAIERFRLRYELRAYTNQVIGTSGTAGIRPGFTDRITQVRAAAASTIDVTSQMAHFYNRLRHFDIGMEHDFGRLIVDYNAVYSQTHINSGTGDGGTLINRLSNVGFILDRTQSDLYPSLIHTEGPDFRDPSNYRPFTLTFNDADEDHEVRELRGNVRYKLATSFPLALKTGLRWRQEQPSAAAANRQYRYIGTQSLADDPTIRLFGLEKTRAGVPVWNANAISVGRNPVNPALWQENEYFREQSGFTGTRGVIEDVSAAYVMAQGRVGQTGFLAGVRTEKTEDKSWGWVRSRVLSTAAEQLADPVGSALRDYGNNYRELRGSYTKSFPSAHLTHDLNRNLKARLSWSTSFGRPPMSSLLPNESVSEANQTLTINNPSLLPQNAANWDASLDYYLEPFGTVSVGWFHKSIKDFIVSGIESGTVPSDINNGYDGEYGGYRILTSANAGTAIAQGWEFSYQQQLSFLPGLLKGLGILANYTIIDTHGNFGGTTNLTTGQVAGFKPRTGNLSLRWAHRGFSARVLVNYTGDYISSYSAASVGRNLYVLKRTTTNLGLEYQLRPWLRLTCDVSNLFNEPQAFYRGIPDQMQSVIITGTLVTFGVAGRF